MDVKNNVATESVWENRGAAALTFGLSVDRFVPDKTTFSLTEATGTKKEFRLF